MLRSWFSLWEEVIKFPAEMRQSQIGSAQRLFWELKGEQFKVWGWGWGWRLEKTVRVL